VSVREYQTYAEDATVHWLNNSTSLGGVVAMPTGVGKSHVQANLMRRLLSYRPGSRMMGLVHVKELIGQNVGKLKEIWPNAPIGVYSAGLKQRQMEMPITWGGVASVHKIIRDFGKQDLLFIDECQLLNPNAMGGIGEPKGMYNNIIEQLLDMNPYLRIVGSTATWWRLGLGSIINGTVFQDKIVDMTGVEAFNWFIEQGYLSRLITRPTQTKIDLSGVGVSGVDYNQTEAAKAFDQAAITYQAIQEILYYGQNRRKWLIFATGVDHAEHICDQLNYMGIPTTVVHSKMSSGERDQRIADYKAGKYRAIVNNNVLTTGFDDPEIDLMAILRATISPALWVQILGRGTRPYYVLGGADKSVLDTVEGRFWAMQNGGKLNCLVLDFAGNAARLGPINDPVLPEKKGNGTGEAPIKICTHEKLTKVGGVRPPGCGNYNHPSARHCEYCHAEFDFAVKFSSASYTQDLVASEAPQMQWFDISHIFYEKKVGPSGKPYLRVTYWSGSKKFMDMVFLGSEGFLLHKAKGWWSARFKVENPTHPDNLPPTVDDALRFANKTWLKEPRRVLVHVNKTPYPEIHSYEYE